MGVIVLPVATYGGRSLEGQVLERAHEFCGPMWLYCVLHGDPRLGSAFLEPLQQHARLAYPVAGQVPAPLAPVAVHEIGVAAAAATASGGGGFAQFFWFQHQVLAARNDVHDAAGSHGFEVLHQLSRRASEGLWRIRALGGEIVQLLVVGVQHDLLLVRIFKRLGPLDGRALALRHDRGRLLESRNVPAQDVHQHRFGHVVGVVARDYMLDAQLGRSSVQRLATEYTTIRARIPDTCGLHYLVHRPVVQIPIGEYLQGQIVLLLVSLDRSQRVVPVPDNTFVDAQKHNADAIFVSLIQELQNVRQHRRVLTTGRTHRNPLSLAENTVGDDGLVDLRLKHMEKTEFTNLLQILGSLDNRFPRMAQLAEL